MLKILITLIYILFSAQVHAWTINADFEDGAVGAKANGADGFTGAFKKTRYTDKVVHNGKGAAVVGITEGVSGWGEWGGSFKYPEPLYEGGEVWFRVWTYFPPGFSFECGGCSQGIKFMRIHTVSVTGANEGYHSILLNNGVSIDSEVTGKTFHSNNSGKKLVGRAVTIGAWHAHEMYIKFSSTPGKGIYRVWQDGNLIFEDTVTRTLNTSNSKSDLIYFFTYWNNDAPKTQSAYVDDIVVTSARPAKTDDSGNPFIGAADDYELVSRPRSPLANIR